MASTSPPGSRSIAGRPVRWSGQTADITVRWEMRGRDAPGAYEKYLACSRPLEKLSAGTVTELSEFFS